MWGMFILHPRLAADTFEIIELALCKLLLMNNSSIPWLVLVPKRADSVEISDLSAADSTILWQEINHVHNTLRTLTQADKMNVGALGNMVPQLHIHIIARNKQDAAWPNPIWGNIPDAPYTEADAEAFIQKIRTAFTQ